MIYYILHMTLWFMMLAEDGIINSYAFEPKNKKTARWKHILGIMAVGCPFMLVKMLSNENFVLKNIFLILMILSVLVYLQIFFEGNLGEKILFRMMCVVASFIAEMSGVIIMRKSIETTVDYAYICFGAPVSFVLCIYIYVITSMMYCLIFYIHKRFIMKKSYSSKFFFVYSSFPISQILLMLSLNMKIYAKVNFETITVLTGIVGSIFADAFLLYTLLKQQQMQELSRMLYEVETAWEREKNHYIEIEERRGELAKIRHDLNEQLFVMNELLRKKEYEKVRDMLKTLVQYVDSTKECIYCADPILNAIMAENEKLCQSKKIELSYDFKIDRPLCMNPVTICSIFSNLLRNAVTASESVVDCEKRKYISIKAKEQGGYLYVEVENSYEKRKKSSRKGYGQEILRDITEKHNGKIEISTENETYKVCMMVENREN